MSKITFLFDPQPEEFCQYVLKSLVNLSLSVLIKKGSYKKEYNIRSFSLIFFLSLSTFNLDPGCLMLKAILHKDLELIKKVAKW